MQLINYMCHRKSIKKNRYTEYLLYITICVSLSEALFLIMEVHNRKFVEIQDTIKKLPCQRVSNVLAEK